MKLTKIFAITSLFSLAVVGTAFAGAGSTTSFLDSGTITVGTPSVGVKPSKNVTVVYKASTATPPNTSGSIGYSIGAFHASGDKSFGSSSGDTKLFWSVGTGTAPVAAPESAGASAAYGAGWTSM